MIATGKQLRDAAIARALSPQDEWIERYTEILLDWFEGRPDGYRFTGEKLRIAAREKGLGEPRHFNRWSAAARPLINGWLNERKLAITGRFVQAKMPATHAHALREYEKTVSRRYRVADVEDQMELLA
jgi:hypothetical protein